MSDKIMSTTVKFWTPYTSEYADATNSVEVKAPETGNKEKRARNQSVVRTRAGNTKVYDRGNNFNTNIALAFKDIVDIERAALLVFLEAIQWASTKVAYEDMYGDVFYVRILQDNGIEYEDRGPDILRGPSRIRWNFSLDLLNLTDNLAELAIPDAPVSSALSLHLADFNEPHNPEVCQTIDAADGAVVLEGFLTGTWRTIIWTVCVQKGTDSATYLVVGSHNRNGVTAASTTSIQLHLLEEHGDVSSHIIFALALTLSGLAQLMSLTCDVTGDDWHVCVRRSKMGTV